MGALVLGAALSVSTMKFGNFHSPGVGHHPNLTLAPPAETRFDPTIARLVISAPAQRASQLEAIAKGAASTNRNRARYLLAVDLIQQKQGAKALTWLEGLETDYALLAPHIWVQRARAYEVSGKPAQAIATWKTLIERHPKHPAAAEALYRLGQKTPQYWNQLISQFPAHPRSSDVARARLKKQPNDRAMLLLLAKHAFYAPGITSVLDQLVLRYALTLQPADWEAIAFAYWENQVYGKAGRAYLQAPATPLTRYRAARGLQLDGKGAEAFNLYQRVVSLFPKTPEAALALRRMARLAPTPLEGIPYLDAIIEQFPDRAAEAWAIKAELYEQAKNTKAAAQARQLVLTSYKTSKAAAEIRWQQAWKRAEAGDYLMAWKWAQPITTDSPDSELAPEAAFWVGKWAERLGKHEDARSAFEYVLTNHPETYYAWRSAVALGLKVGDFTNVRLETPRIAAPLQRPEISAGSEALKELYHLGQNLDAWKLWQVEFRNPKQPTVAEQFTDGVMRLGVGDNLDGLFMVSSLDQRERPEEQSQYKSLKGQLGYWLALYPFPYIEQIKAWSQQRQLNPLLVVSLMRQESRFEHKIRSSVGATGLMQVMPETGEWIAGKISLKHYNLEDPDDNIKLGTWYLDYTHNEYNNHSLLAVASYNAGPGNVADWVAKKGLQDPDVFVEEIPFDETRGYVKSVFENYWNYLRLYDPDFSKLVR